MTTSLEVFENLKLGIYKTLMELITQENFLKAYGEEPLFNFFYLKNSNYIITFINNLPLSEIFNDPKFNTAEKIINHIIELFYLDVSLQKDLFPKKVVLLYGTLFLGKIVTHYITWYIFVDFSNPEFLLMVKKCCEIAWL